MDTNSKNFDPLAALLAPPPAGPVASMKVITKTTALVHVDGNVIGAVKFTGSGFLAAGPHGGIYGSNFATPAEAATVVAARNGATFDNL